MTSQVSGFQNLPPSLLSRLNQMQQSLTLLQNRVGYSENGIVNIYNNVTNITNEITEVTEELTQTNQYITNITNQVTNITNEITEVTEQITYTTENITVVQNEIIEITNNYIDGVELLEDFNLQLDALTLRVTSAEQVIDFLEFNVTRLNNDVADLFRDLNDLEDYIDSEIASHTHNQIVQVNNANTYVIASGNTVETRLNNQSVQEATVSSYKQTLPYTTVQKYNFNAIFSQMQANSFITMDIVRKMHLLNTFTCAVGDSMLSYVYTFVIDQNQTVMRHVDQWVGPEFLQQEQYGVCMVWNNSQQCFKAQVKGIYRISYTLTYNIEAISQTDLNVNLAIDVQTNQYPYSQLISGLYDLTNDRFVNSNANRTDMRTNMVAGKETIFEHINSYIAVLDTTDQYRFLSPAFQFGGGSGTQRGTINYAAISFEFMQK